MEKKQNMPPYPTKESQSVQEAFMQNFMLYFGQMLMNSFAPAKQFTVAELIDHVIDSKSGAGRKRKTISSYRYCAIRIKSLMGDKLLHQVQPADISDLFATLKKESKILELRAVLKEHVDIQSILDKEKISKTRLAATAGISQSTTDRALKGYQVLLPKADALASALHLNTADLFNIVQIEKSLSPGTLDDYRRFVSLVFAAAERELQIPFNPVARTEKISTQKKRKQDKALQLEEVHMVLNAADREPIDKKCLIHLFLITGGRRGEIAGLRWSCIYWDINAILIDHTILYTPEDGTYSEDSTKSGQDRLIRLPQEAMNILREYQQWQNARKTKLGERWIESDYIFTGRNGGPISPDTISCYIKRFQEKYDLPHLHPHKFRHTHASILLYSGMDIVRVSKRLGHLDVSTTLDYYAHLLLQADIESAECIGDLFYRQEETQ